LFKSWQFQNEELRMARGVSHGVSLRVGLNLRANLQGQGEDLLRGLRSRYH